MVTEKGWMEDWGKKRSVIGGRNGEKEERYEESKYWKRGRRE
jgi:hypothetical protein